NGFEVAVRREANEAAPTLLPQPLRDFETASLAERPVEDRRVIDAVQGEELDVVHPQAPQGVLEVPLELPWLGLGRDLRLKDQAVPRQRGKNAAQLSLTGAVAPGRFDVADAQVHGAANRRLEVALRVGRDGVERLVLPPKLKPH